MIQLRQTGIDLTITTDEIEDIDIEEIGFQATYAKLAVAGLPPVDSVPFASVDDAVKHFVVKLAAADAAVQGALVRRIRSELPQEAIAGLAGWGVRL